MEVSRKNAEVILNILFWLLSGWLIINSFSIVSQELEVVDGTEFVHVERSLILIKQLCICLVLSLLLFYANFLNLRQLRKELRGTQIWLRSLLLVGLVLLIHYLIRASGILDASYYLPASLLFGITVFYYAISCTYALAKVWRHSEKQRQQLTLEKKQVELDLLRSQLHPHFLFNALNNLLSLVNQKENPVLASSLDQLSGLLRYVVYDTAKQRVPIRKEIEFIRNFAELHSLRFEEKEIEFSLVITGEYDQQEIAPGIFIPLIENIFKYGVEPENKSALKVSFDLSKPSLIRFSSTNPIYPTMQKIKGNGSGISSTKERLELIYPNRHQFIITETETFNIELEIQTYESNHR